MEHQNKTEFRISGRHTHHEELLIVVLGRFAAEHDDDNEKATAPSR